MREDIIGESVLVGNVSNEQIRKSFSVYVFLAGYQVSHSDNSFLFFVGCDTVYVVRILYVQFCVEAISAELHNHVRY